MNKHAPKISFGRRANIVTLTRILLVPVFVVALLSPWPDYFPHWDDAELFKPWLAAFLLPSLLAQTLSMAILHAVEER